MTETVFCREVQNSMAHAIQVETDHGNLNEPRNVRRFLGLSREDFARMGGFTDKMISDWEEGLPLEESLGRRVEELSRLLESLTHVMRAESVAEWLSRPNQAFAGLKPSEVIERGDYECMRRKIYQLESGIPT